MEAREYDEICQYVSFYSYSTQVTTTRLILSSLFFHLYICVFRPSKIRIFMTDLFRIFGTFQLRYCPYHDCFFCVMDDRYILSQLSTLQNCYVFICIPEHIYPDINGVLMLLRATIFHDMKHVLGQKLKGSLFSDLSGV